MKGLLRSMVQSRMTLIMATIGLLLIVGSFAVSLLVSSSAVNAPNYERILSAPSWMNGDGGFLGTDRLGRPLDLRILYGLKTSYFVGIFAISISAAIGTVVGMTAGFWGGKTDAVLMRITDIQLAFPALLMAMVIIGLVGGGTVVVAVVLGVNSWMLFARVIRSIILSMRQAEFVQGLEAIGARPRRIMWAHLLPNALGPLAAVGTIELARVMLAEAALSFLGLGVKAPEVSLGAIMAEGRSYVTTNWWVTGFAGLALALAVLSLNITGSWLERQLDPVKAIREEAGNTP